MKKFFLFTVVCSLILAACSTKPAVEETTAVETTVETTVVDTTVSTPVAPVVETTVTE